MNISYKETEQILKLVFKFVENSVTLSGERNVGFGEKQVPSIKGVVKKGKSVAVH